MVVVCRLARDVGVLARRQVEALDGAQIDQDVECPEDRRPADPEPPSARIRDEVGRGEMTVA